MSNRIRNAVIALLGSVVMLFLPIMMMGKGLLPDLILHLTFFLFATCICMISFHILVLISCDSGTGEK